MRAAVAADEQSALLSRPARSAPAWGSAGDQAPVLLRESGRCMSLKFRQPLALTRQALRDRPFILCIDETGDRKPGKVTDYTASQYIGTVHRLANALLPVNPS